MLIIDSLEFVYDVVVFFCKYIVLLIRYLSTSNLILYLQKHSSRINYDALKSLGGDFVSIA